jgi:hypothetical protein
MRAGTVIFEGVRREPKRNRGPQKVRSIAELTTLRRLAKITTHGHSRQKGRANFDPALNR